MTERVSDLPVGSIVANDHTAWIKVSKADADLGCWGGTNDELGTYDWEPQEALDNGAAVLRRGVGAPEIEAWPGCHVEDCQCLVRDGAVLNVDLRCEIP